MEEVEKLNEAQQRRLYTSCQYIDGLLCNLDQALHQADSLSPFPRYAVDLDQAQVDRFERQIRNLRQQVLRALAWQRMKPAVPAIPVSHMIFTNLSLIEIAIEELSPESLRGYGTIPEGALGSLNETMRSLLSIAQQMELDLRQILASRQTREE
jgi:hypothetical protein